MIDTPDRPDEGTRTSTLEAPSASGFLSLDEERKASIRLLVVDDDRTLRESCSRFLETEGYKATTVRRGEEAKDLLRRQTFDIVLLDLYMSGVPGMDLLRVALETNPKTVVIVMTGNPSVASSVEALRAGAWDYLPKPFSANHLEILIGRAAHAVLVARESEELQSTLDERQEGRSDHKVTVLGSSPAFQHVLDIARRVAQTDASVFLNGESGTGKELIAQFIHQHSRRSSRSLVAVNCAAIPESLLESEMFGHRKGAFTGAVRDKTGLLEAANGGTLFLDELTEMPTAVQAKLLRVIQDGVVRRVGSETVDAVVNVRFLAATNQDVERAVEQGTLREDLYYRLRVVPITIPPLRERPSDIPVLAEYFMKLYWQRHRGQRTPMPTFAGATLETLKTRQWQGNVRELQNVIEHAVVLLEPGTVVEPHHLQFAMHDNGHGSTTLPTTAAVDFESGRSYHAAREELLADFERRYLMWLLQRASGNMSRAARIAEVDRTTLYRLMEKHGLQRETIMVRAD